MTIPAAQRIDINDSNELDNWAKKFNATSDQIRDAVAQVGDHPDDVELYLKGSRASSNSERVADQGV